MEDLVIPTFIISYTIYLVYKIKIRTIWSVTIDIYGRPNWFIQTTAFEETVNIYLCLLTERAISIKVFSISETLLSW